MCRNRLHLTLADRRLLTVLQIAPWPCPACGNTTGSPEAEPATPDTDADSA